MKIDIMAFSIIGEQCGRCLAATDTKVFKRNFGSISGMLQIVKEGDDIVNWNHKEALTTNLIQIQLRQYIIHTEIN